MTSVKSKKRVSWFRLFFWLLVFYFLYIIGSQQLELMQLRQQAREVDRELNQAVLENQKLTAEKDNLNNLGYVEKLAREELGMVKPGELPYISPARPGTL